MAKKTIISTGVGKLALFFLITGIVGVIFQFIYLYLPIIKVVGGTYPYILFIILHISAFVFGVVAIILSIFTNSRIIWILLCVFVLVLTFIPPIMYAVKGGVNFPYFDIIFTQIGYYLTIPTNPLLDFIGFWMASGGAFIAAVIGFTLPKK